MYSIMDKKIIKFFFGTMGQVIWVQGTHFVNRLWFILKIFKKVLKI